MNHIDESKEREAFEQAWRAVPVGSLLLEPKALAWRVWKIARAALQRDALKVNAEQAIDEAKEPEVFEWWFSNIYGRKPDLSKGYDLGRQVAFHAGAVLAARGALAQPDRAEQLRQSTLNAARAAQVIRDIPLLSAASQPEPKPELPKFTYADAEAMMAEFGYAKHSDCRDLVMAAFGRGVAASRENDA